MKVHVHKAGVVVLTLETVDEAVHVAQSEPLPCGRKLPAFLTGIKGGSRQHMELQVE